MCALGLYACGSNAGTSSIDASDPGSGTVVGTIDGMQYTVGAASGGIVTEGNTASTQYAQITLSSQSDSCAQIEEHIEHPNQQVVIIDLGDNNSPPTAPGVYTVSNAITPTGLYANVYANATDSNCQLINVPPPSATSGTVTLTGVDGSAYSGTFDVVFDGSDHVTGSFATVNCLPSGSASGDTTCQ
jgi:hypothetical protein